MRVIPPPLRALVEVVTCPTKLGSKPWRPAKRSCCCVAAIWVAIVQRADEWAHGCAVSEVFDGQRCFPQLELVCLSEEQIEQAGDRRLSVGQRQNSGRKPSRQPTHAWIEHDPVQSVS